MGPVLLFLYLKISMAFEATFILFLLQEKNAVTTYIYISSVKTV